MQFIINKITKPYHHHSKCSGSGKNKKSNSMSSRPTSSSSSSFSPSSYSLPNMAFAMLSLVLLAILQSASAGSCREAQLCCSGRDSSCVVQKAPVNTINEDISDKPCYCDHACLKLGDCCDDFKDHCGVLDCRVSDWGQWSECDKICGTGMMSRTRKVLQAAQNGGKHCPSLVQKRGCQGLRCHGHRDKKILREMALLLPAALSRNRHANDSSDIRRNLRLRYRDTYKHNREHEYCVEFEVLKASKACHKLPPYNQMLEGDRITVRCDLEALIQDSTTTTTSSNNINTNTHHHGKYKTTTITKSAANNNRKTEITNNSAISDDDAGGAAAENHDDPTNNDSNAADTDDDDDDDADDEADEENMLDNDENYEYDPASFKATRIKTTTTTTTTTTTPVPPPPPAAAATALSYHCRGEGLPGRTTRWSALAAPSCRGKWLRLTVGAPKKCTHSQFIFV